jgi:iron complex outermembrane receptor protein
MGRFMGMLVATTALTAGGAGAESAAPVAGAVQTAQSQSQGNGDGTVELDTIDVEGAGENPYGPVKGFVPNRSLAGTKTDTPIEEIPQSLSVITRDRMDQQDSDSLPDVFRYTPGVKGEVNGNDTRVDFIRFRGFNDDGNALFREGLALRSSGFGQFRPELYGVQRVEVLRGPASVLFGQGNPGGLVNLVTKRPQEDPFAEVQLELGNFEHREGKFDLGGPVPGSDKVFVRLTGLGRKSDTQVDFVDDDRVYIAPAVTVKPTPDTNLTILAHVQDDDTGSTNQFLPAQGTIQDNPNGSIDTDTFTGNPDFDDFKRTVYSLGYTFEHDFSDALKLRQNARYNKLEVDSEQVFGGGLQPDLRTLNRFAFTADAETEGATVDTNVQARLATGPAKHTLLFGVDYQVYDFAETQGFGLAPSLDIFDPTYSGTVPSAPTFLDTDTEQEQIGVYVQDQIRLYDRVVLTLGGRHDWVDSEVENRISGTTTDQSDSEFTGRVGVVYLTDFGVSPYVSYAESFLPTPGTNAEGEAFDPTTGQQWEAGVRYQPPGTNARISLAGFNLVRQNVRTTDPDNPLNDVQTGEVRSRGIEIEANASLDAGIDLTVGYTFQDVEKTKDNDGFEGKRPRQVPEHEAAAWVHYTVQSGFLEGLGLGTGVRYKGSTFADNANTLEVDGFTLVDAAVSYDWRSFSFKVNAENLFDNKHVASCTSANACFFGTDRRVVGNVTYRW